MIGKKLPVSCDIGHGVVGDGHHGIVSTYLAGGSEDRNMNPDSGIQDQSWQSDRAEINSVIAGTRQDEPGPACWLRYFVDGEAVGAFERGYGRSPAWKGRAHARRLDGEQ